MFFAIESSLSNIDLADVFDLLRSASCQIHSVGRSDFQQRNRKPFLASAVSATLVKHDNEGYYYLEMILLKFTLQKRLYE